MTFKGMDALPKRDFALEAFVVHTPFHTWWPNMQKLLQNYSEVRYGLVQNLCHATICLEFILCSSYMMLSVNPHNRFYFCTDDIRSTLFCKSLEHPIQYQYRTWFDF